MNKIRFVLALIAATTLTQCLVGFGAASASADDNVPLQTAADEFTFYTGAHVFNLNVVKNDPSKNTPDYLVCRLTTAPGQNLNFGSSTLKDGRIDVAINPKFHGDSVELIYQPCTTTALGPQTSITIHVNQLKKVKPTVAGKKVTFVNHNADPVMCALSTTGSSPSTYFEKKVAAAGGSVTTKLRGRVSNYLCYFIGGPSVGDGKVKR